jgi:hypothetical protein
MLTRQRVGRERRLEIAELAGAAPDLGSPLLTTGDAGRVVTAYSSFAAPR